MCINYSPRFRRFRRALAAVGAVALLGLVAVVVVAAVVPVVDAVDAVGGFRRVRVVRLGGSSLRSEEAVGAVGPFLNRLPLDAVELSSDRSVNFSMFCLTVELVLFADVEVGFCDAAVDFVGER